jgi:hypothetical protein
MGVDVNIVIGYGIIVDELPKGIINELKERYYNEDEWAIKIDDTQLMVHEDVYNHQTCFFISIASTTKILMSTKTSGRGGYGVPLVDSDTIQPSEKEIEALKKLIKQYYNDKNEDKPGQKIFVFFD